MAQTNLDVNLPSTSTSYGNNKYNVYDVFVNHRGPDVKKTLASDLYNRLRGHGLRVFLDVNELEQGENLTPQIEGAIRTASVHIAIFSTTYVESIWCLNELVLMLESGSIIIPVFYRVKPSDLRWTFGTNGVYAQALCKLEEKRTFDHQTGQQKPRYDSNTIQKWRKALYDVAEISGFDLDTYNGDEQQLLEQVVERVVKKVKIALHVSKYPTGLDQKVEDFERTVLLQQQIGEVRVIGIVGSRGVGKTTLAKEIFNRERSNYSRSCCLFDVRETSLITLQSIALKNLAQFTEQIYSVDDGIEKLRRYLSSLHALVILDNVDHLRQLDALLLPMKDVLREGSLILVISCNKNVLANSDIADSSIYMLTCLDQQHSKELFCSHAFGQPHPVVGFDKVVEKYLDVCDGLPLSLTVLGASLRGIKDLTYWSAQLRQIAEEIPTDIQGRLKTSYDGLNPQEKQIFLDIACFFIGEDSDTAIRIWDGSGWEGWLGLHNLENKCLLEVDSENCIIMHDHLRDLGRDLAKKEPPGCPLRLWRPTDNLLHLSSQSPVRGINMLQRRSGQSFENPVALGNRMFSISRLELVWAEGDCLESIFSSVQSPNLLYLCWYGCPYPSLPPWIPMNSLRVLEVEGSKLETLWGDLNSQAPLQLRELNIIDAPLLKIPKSIGKLKHLEKFVLHHGYLETLPDEFCRLQYLKHLELVSCSEMKSLPDSFGNLTKLQHIDLSRCINLQMLPNSFGNLVQLQHLELKSCSEMMSLPDSFGNLTKLQHIELSQCKKLQRLPYSFGNLVQLQNLYLGECYKLTIPDTFGKISTLQCLDLSSCSKIQVLPPQVENNRLLRQLILKCTRLKELPSSIGQLIHLEVLILDSQLLKMLPPSLGSLRSLQQLEILSSQLLKCLPESIGDLSSLKQLWIQSLKQLKCFPKSIGYLRSLEKLVIWNCQELKCLPPCVMELNNLARLEMDDCGSCELPFRKDAGKGGRLTYSTSSKLDTSNVKCMLGMKYLKLRRMGISEVSFCKGVCPNLQYLKIKDCHFLVEVGALPTTLIELELWNCVALRKISVLAQLTRLRVLNINSCFVLEELQGIEHLTSLKLLNTGLCMELPWLPSLETLTSLERMDISGCCNLKSIKGLAQLTKLRTLEVARCYQLEELEGVEHTRSLKRLNASECCKLQWDGKVMEQLRQRLKEGLIV